MEGMEWLNRLNGNPLPWLLEETYPSVRYFTLLHLLDRPSNDPDVQTAKAAIPNSELVQSIFSQQHPVGYWEEEDKPQWPTRTIEAISLLMLLGVDRDERIERACKRIIQYNQHKSGGFTYTGTRSGVFNCFTGNALEFLVYYGFGEDPTVENGFRFLVEMLSQEDGLCCSRNAGVSCLWGAIGALRGFARLPEHLRDTPTQKVIAGLANALLDYSFRFDGAEKRWLKFSIPPAYDLLEALLVLTKHGYSQDARFLKLANIIQGQQTSDGRWVKGSGGKSFPLDQTGKPSKFITLNALRVIKPTASVINNNN